MVYFLLDGFLHNPIHSTPPTSQRSQLIEPPSCMSTREVCTSFPLSGLVLYSFHLDGRKERVQFDKITARVSRLCYALDPDHIDAAAITQKVISGVYQGVTTIELDNLVSPFWQIRGNLASPKYTLLTLLKGCRDCCIYDSHTSRLCHFSCSDCGFQPPQANQETILACYPRFISIYKPKEWYTISYD